VYTQCSKCETVFKLSAEVLRTAGGQVRCGKCGEVFNALARLAEDSSAFSTGESPLELETRADSILESAAPQVAHVVAKEAKQTKQTKQTNEHEDHGPPGVQMARLEFIDTDVVDSAAAPGGAAPPGSTAADDRSLEFTLPPGELDRIFIESRKRALQPLAPPPAEVEVDLPVHPESAAAQRVSARVSGLEVPEDVRRDMLEGIEQPLPPASEFLRSGRGSGRGRLASPAARRRQFIVWLSAAIVSALLLTILFLPEGLGSLFSRLAQARRSGGKAGE